MAEVQAKRVDSMAAIDHDRICYGKEWKEGDDGYFIYFPGFGAGMLSKHRIEEHADGTITAYPSIRFDAGAKVRHGWLKHGIWESCGDEVV